MPRSALLHGSAVLLEPARERGQFRRRVTRPSPNAVWFLGHAHEYRFHNGKGGNR